MNPLRMTPDKIRIAGHRGHSIGAPENTLAAFRRAHAIGGAGVTCETDLAITKDEELILMHDATVDRTTNGHGLVRSMTYAEIASLDAGSWFNETFAGEKVPLLRDAVLLARDLGIFYQLELKIYNQNELIFRKLRSLIDELGCAKLLQFSSFNFVQLKELKLTFPEIPTVSLSYSRFINPAAQARESGVDAVNIEIQHFPSGEAHQLRKEGLSVCLFVPSGVEAEKLKSYGFDIEAAVVDWVCQGLLDQIVSDDVALMAKIVRTARERMD